ncbi:MAG: hypothetical protein M0P26_00685 [Bacteroidales bacterium]|nr:hypothetical protein [Bacteroidales bacterium]
MNREKESVINTWPKFSQEMQKMYEFGGYLKSAEKMASSQVETMLLTTKSPMEKVQAIDEYMKSNFNWDKYYSKFSNQSVKKFLETKTGNSAEINIYYVGLLRSAGLDAFPVILSTRDHGKLLLDYPFEHFFNYVVAAAVIDGKFMLFDATEPFAGIGIIPARCINDKGLAIMKGKGEFKWLDLSRSGKSSVFYNIDLTPDPMTDSIYGRFSVKSTGYEALDMRKNYTYDMKEFNQSMNFSNMTLKDTIQVKNLRDVNKLFEVKYIANTRMNVFDNKSSFSPFYAFFFSLNPLQNPTRTYPIDLIYKKEKKISATIHIPAGYKLLNGPNAINIDNKKFNLQLKTDMLNDSTFLIVGGYEFKKEIFSTDEYDEIKGYFRDIVNVFNQEVVLEKIKS